MPAGKISLVNKNMFSLKYIKKLYLNNKEMCNCLLALFIGVIFAKYVLSNNFLNKPKNIFKKPSEKKCGN